MFNKTNLGLIVLMTLAMVFRVIPVEASSSRQITCESKDDRYRFCNTNTRGGVRLVRQLSDTSCRKNSSWGYERDGIWVDNGCRAVFEVRNYNNNSNSNNNHSNNNTAAIVGGALVVGAVVAALASSDNNSNSNTVKCESNNNDYQYCRVRTDNRVTLKRQLSSNGCWEGSTWGYDRDGIWVDQGCRAEFRVR